MPCRLVCVATEGLARCSGSNLPGVWLVVYHRVMVPPTECLDRLLSRRERRTLADNPLGRRHRLVQVDSREVVLERKVGERELIRRPLHHQPATLPDTVEEPGRVVRIERLTRFLHG